ncbi:hypothetical protein Ancab_018216 [Ancistrocladus abbreviatus]
MDAVSVKQELPGAIYLPLKSTTPAAYRPHMIELSSSSSDSESDSSDADNNAGDVNLSFSCSGKRPAISFSDNIVINSGLAKKPKLETPTDIILPVGFLEPLHLDEPGSPMIRSNTSSSTLVVKSCKQFWKAGDYDDAVNVGLNGYNSGCMDHLRVHPRFLHSNATSHKWALGAFAELLDNALDEACNGATYVNVDMLVNQKDNTEMLLVQDNGGGMTPDKMRQCMSLGYSAKSKLANTIGQYGNGFKTSTMRLGADVIVFSCCQGKDGAGSTKSIWLLSYTFLRSTAKEDIVVPMIDFEKKGHDWAKMIRTNTDDWYKNLETIAHWSPFSSEEELLQQFNLIKDQGTRIIIYNLWEDDEGQLELDFDTDPMDIQIRGVNRDEKKILMAKKYPNSKHYLTCRHSLRSYASILYLRLPPGFRIILRGKDVDHHNLIDDMVHITELTYRPVPVANVLPIDMVAVVTIGFVKDAVDHIDIQGFNVYHKNRLIKPFWRVWNAAGSDGRGVLGVLEANFVEPAHDKQGFERTTALSRLEARLVHMQKNYWRSNCDKIGYAPRQQPKKSISPTRESPPLDKGKFNSVPNQNRHACNKGTSRGKNPNTHARSNEASKAKSDKIYDESSHSAEFTSEDDSTRNDSNELPARRTCVKKEKIHEVSNASADSHKESITSLRKENLDLAKRIVDLQLKLQFEKDKCASLAAQLRQAEEKAKEMDKEQEALIQIFSEERDRRDKEEENLRNKLKDASTTIQELLDKVKML